MNIIYIQLIQSESFNVANDLWPGTPVSELVFRRQVLQVVYGHDLCGLPVCPGRPVVRVDNEKMTTIMLFNQSVLNTR